MKATTVLALLVLLAGTILIARRVQCVASPASRRLSLYEDSNVIWQASAAGGVHASPGSVTVVQWVDAHSGRRFALVVAPLDQLEVAGRPLAPAMLPGR